MSLRLRNNVALIETDEGAVLLDEASGRYFQLNPSGVLILRALQKDGSLEDAACALAEVYDVEKKQALDDAGKLLDALRAAKLVKR